MARAGMSCHCHCRMGRRMMMRPRAMKGWRYRMGDLGCLCESRFGCPTSPSPQPLQDALAQISFLSFLHLTVMPAVKPTITLDLGWNSYGAFGFQSKRVIG